MDQGELDAVIAGFQAAFTWWRRPDLVSVAAVQGHAVGAGFQLALACDLRVVAEDAQLAMREPSLGLVPDLTGTSTLVEAVGYARALEICLSGRWVTGAEAVTLGLAQQVVPGPALHDAARDLLSALVTAPAGAALETKALLAAAARRSPDDQRAAERSAQGRRLAELRALVADQNP